MATDKPTRMTARRRVLLDELRRSRAHPTADEVYRRVRRRLPTISLGTVYRNLELLAATGAAQVLPSGEGPRRYDGDARPHVHIRCQSCGRVADVAGEPLVDWHAVAPPAGFSIFGYRLELIGVCPRCARRKRKRSPENNKEELPWQR